MPSGYHPRLTVFDAHGQSATVTGQVVVQTSDGRTPPTVRIVALGAGGARPAHGAIQCRGEPGDRTAHGYRWDLGEGRLETTPTASATYLPGRWRVGLEVVDEGGLSARDEVVIVVTRGDAVPPECQAFVSPAVGEAPLTARWSALAASEASAILQVRWSFDDGSTATGMEAVRLYPAAGRQIGRLRVEDEAGLACEDAATLTVLSEAGLQAPHILAVPQAPARCRAPYGQGEGTRLAGGGRRDDALDAPARSGGDDGRRDDRGARLAAADGARAVRSETVAVENAAGRDEQSFEVEVRCSDALALESGVGAGRRGATRERCRCSRWCCWQLQGLARKESGRPYP